MVPKMLLQPQFLKATVMDLELDKAAILRLDQVLQWIPIRETDITLWVGNLLRRWMKKEPENLRICLIWLTQKSKIEVKITKNPHLTTNQSNLK